MSIWKAAMGKERRIWLVTALTLASPLPALAQEVAECDWRAAAQAIAEPWEANSRTFANGAIRLAVMDVLEPAAGAYHLLILSPPYSELGERQCRVMSAEGSMGFAGLSLDGASASYDPATGLTVSLPAKRWSDGDVFTDTTLLVTLNQASGAISGDLE